MADSRHIFLGKAGDGRHRAGGRVGRAGAAGPAAAAENASELFKPAKWRPPRLQVEMRAQDGKPGPRGVRAATGAGVGREGQMQPAKCRKCATSGREARPLLTGTGTRKRGALAVRSSGPPSKAGRSDRSALRVAAESIGARSESEPVPAPR